MPERARQHPRPAAGLHPPQRPAMRFLHPGHVDGCQRTAHPQAARQPRGSARMDEWQLLPLHRLPGHRRCRVRSACRPPGRPPGRSYIMNAPENRQLQESLQKSLDLAQAARAEAPQTPVAEPLGGALKNARHIGQAIPRPNIERLTEGRGQYVDDLELPRMAHVGYWRSPVAHARILRIERDYARLMPGVLGVFDGADLATICKPWVATLTHLAGIKSAPQYPMAIDRACWQGEPVVAV